MIDFKIYIISPEILHKLENTGLKMELIGIRLSGESRDDGLKVHTATLYGSLHRTRKCPGKTRAVSSQS